MATIVDVAKQAGVSTATVSRVINNSGKVKDVTRRKVLNAIKLHNFTPNIGARVLQNKRTKIIGMVFPDASSTYFTEIIRGILNCVNQHDYQVIIGSAHDEEEEMKAVSRFLNGRTVDGLIIMAPSLQNDEIYDLQAKYKTPAVFISVPRGKPGTSSVVLDNFNMAMKMTNHLISIGHKEIAFIKGPVHNYDSQRRYKGYLEALQNNQIKINDGFVIQGNFTEYSGYKAFEKTLASLSPRPTAIFAANDAMAIGAIEAIKDFGLKVPSDIAVVGFDDISTSQYITPALTTVHVPLFDMGLVVGKTLLQKIENTSEQQVAVSERIVIQLEMIIRESCGAKQAK